MNRQENSIFSPPVFDGTNHAYWKIKMRMFIKSIDERAWRSVLTGWTPPTMTNDKGEEFIKPEIHWTNAESAISGLNSKALNAIYNAVDAKHFDLIYDCTSAKEAWDILEIAYEENIKLRLIKRRIVCMRFVDLKMEENDTVSSFKAKLKDIADEALALGEPYSDEELVLKVLRSLPERFKSTVIAIEDAIDVGTLQLDVLFCMLQVFEMKLAH